MSFAQQAIVSRPPIAKPMPVQTPSIAPAVSMPAAAIQRKCACGGSCPKCSAGKARRDEDAIQTKVQIGAADDQFEQEADRVADRVMTVIGGGSGGAEAPPPDASDASESVRRKVAAPPVLVQLRTAGASVARRKCACGGSLPCTTCKKDEEPRLQRDGEPLSTSDAGSNTDLLPAQLGTGHALDKDTLGQMESGFGASFGNVRVHVGGRASDAARSIRARAYTLGSDIVFGAGQYAPQTPDGERLLAHELTHVVQQGAAGSAATAPSRVQRQSSPGEGGFTDAAGGGGASECPPTPTNLGNVAPAPPCKKPSRYIGSTGEHFGFCPDSDQLTSEASEEFSTFVAAQPADAQFTVHGYASPDGGVAYNTSLACHRANHVAELLGTAGISSANVLEVASKGPTLEFGSDADANRVAVVLAEVPPERRFNQSREDPDCPKTPTNLGNVFPEPACADDPRDVGRDCVGLPSDQQASECASFNFCLDSDVFSAKESPAELMVFARNQPALSTFFVNGYASDEGPQNAEYNQRLSCHRANRVARELLRASVPPERIIATGKGPTQQFEGGAEGNRVGFVRAVGPNLAPTAAIEKSKTQEDKHAIIDAARDRLNEGGYRLEADAYFSFWTCGRIPSVRHAVNTTQFFAEGDPGIPKLRAQDFADATSAGESGGRLGLNTAVVSDKAMNLSRLECVMTAMVLLSFGDKVDSKDFGTDRGKDSEVGKARRHLVEIMNLGCSKDPGEDPRKDKPAPDCTPVAAPTFKGSAAPGEAGVKAPNFQVDESGFRGSSGPTLFQFPVGNSGSMETPANALSASATVSLSGQPQEFPNYEIGYMMTRTVDSTVSHYGPAQQINKGFPTPLRDTDGFTPIEPWFSDGAFTQAKTGRVSVSMSKTMAEVIALRHQELANPTGPTGNALSDATHHSEYQLWLVSRRRGAPKDRFSTRFLSGTRVVFDQNLTLDKGTVGGSFKLTVPITGADSSVLRYGRPIPQDLAVRETSTTNVIPTCADAFGRVSLEVKPNGRAASGVANAVTTQRANLPGGAEIFKIVPASDDSHVKYTPTITIRSRDKDAHPEKFQVGLVQNLLEQDEQFHYSTGDVVRGVCSESFPIRDGDPDPNNSDDVFMSNHEPELAQLDRQRIEAKLKLSDMPGTGATIDRSKHPGCPGLKSGTLTRVVSKAKFRTWAMARFDKESSCLEPLHHIDWETNYDATVNPDTLTSKSIVVTNTDGDGSPQPTLGGKVANEVCGDDSCS